jgi:hypothetical protein
VTPQNIYSKLCCCDNANEKTNKPHNQWNETYKDSHLTSLKFCVKSECSGVLYHKDFN